MFLEKRADNANTTTIPAPATVATSGDFDGNDGKWSTFVINIGDSNASGSGQNFRVLISTSSSVTQVPLQSKWCSDDGCAGERGVEIFNSRQPLGFETSSSKTWEEDGIYNFPLPYWWSGYIGSNVNGTFGTDNVGLGPSSPQSVIQQKQMVVGNMDQGLYMGEFGIGVLPVDTGGGPQRTFLDNLVENKVIPSKSYSYAAGAYYRNDNKGVLGSLVLGGYDQSRFTAGTGTSVNMVNTQNNTLLVGVQSIIYHPDPNNDANAYSFTSEGPGFLAAIDSTLPYLWLPDNICDHFQDKFQLTYDKNENLYRVNDSAHDQNTRQNATVSFKIGTSPTNDNQATSITLPYAAFDLEANSPIFPNATRYFPIRKSPSGIFVLGRAFLQEAYLIVDYERNNFTVAPAISSPAKETILPVFSTSYVPPQTSETPAPQNGGGGLSGGAIAGIVVGILAVLGIIAVGAFFFWTRRREERRKLEEKVSEIDTTTAGDQVKHRRVSELDSEPPGSPKPSMGGYYDRDKDVSPFPPINEMESPPAELYSPPPESIAGLSSGTPQSERTATDYFIAGNKVRRRGATRESSTGQNTPGTPNVIAELPGDDGGFTVDGQHFEPVASPTLSPAQSEHSRGPSNTSLPSNIDEVISGSKAPEAEKAETADKAGEQQQLERRPSHARGPSDTTVKSESTAVSQPTPDELDEWAKKKDEPRRPLSE